MRNKLVAGAIPRIETPESLAASQCNRGIQFSLDKPILAVPDVSLSVSAVAQRSESDLGITTGPLFNATVSPSAHYCV